MRGYNFIVELFVVRLLLESGEIYFILFFKIAKQHKSDSN